MNRIATPTGIARDILASRPARRPRLGHAARLAALALLMLLPALATATTPVTERSDATVAADGIKLLRVDNSRGRIEVRPSTDGRLHVTAIKTIRAGRQGKVEEYRRQTTVGAERQGDTYAITVHYPKRIDVQIDFWDLFRSHRGDQPFITRIEVTLIIEAPRTLAVETRSVSGDAVTEGIAGMQTLSSTSGDLSVRHATSAVRVSSTSGDIVIDDAPHVIAHTASGDIDVQHVGSLVAETTSGDVQAATVGDSVSIETASGDVQVGSAPRGARIHTVSGEIDLRGAAKRIVAESASGEITLGVVAPFAAVDAHSTSGAVHVLLAGKPDCDVDLESTSGDLESEVGLQLLHHSRNTLQGRLGKGGPPIRIRTASGDISVKSEGR